MGLMRNFGVGAPSGDSTAAWPACAGFSLGKSRICESSCQVMRRAQPSPNVPISPNGPWGLWRRVAWPLRWSAT
jgi:hypothetical protein